MASNKERVYELIRSNLQNGWLKGVYFFTRVVSHNKIYIQRCFVTIVMSHVELFKGMFRLGAKAIGEGGQYVPCGMQMGPRGH